jgi:DNA-directed RNA polymerase specialized sigma24 family protein
MSIAHPSNPYERFMKTDDRERIVASLQRQYQSRVGSDEVDDAYSYMLERLSNMPTEEVDAIENPATWLFVGMRNRINDYLRLHSANNVHFGDLADIDTLDDVLEHNDDVVVGSLLGREAATERFAQVAEYVWSRFTGTDGQIAARVLIEEQKPQAIAAELGLDPAHVVAIAHQVNKERRQLEKRIQADPEFRCHRLRKHVRSYYETGEISLALRAHWLTCSKCKTADRAVQEHTYSVLAPFLPIAAVPAGLFGVLHRLGHHATHPVQMLRRGVRPAAQLGGKTAAGSTQVSGVAGAISTKAAAIAVTAVVATSGAAASVVVVAHHHHHKPRVTVAPPAPKPQAVVHTTPAVTTTTAHEAPVVHHAPKPKHKLKPKHKRHVAHVVTHTTVAVTPPPPVVTTTVTPPATTATTPPVTTTAPPVTTTTPAVTKTTPAVTKTTPAVTKTIATTTTTQSGVTNPSYQTPQAP